MIGLLLLGVLAISLPLLDRHLSEIDRRRRLDRELRQLGFRPVRGGWQRSEPVLKRECGR